MSRRDRRKAGKAKAGKAKGTPTPLVGHIDLATLMEFERKTPGTKICTCTDFEPQLDESGQLWLGGEHLVSIVPDTGGVVHTHYYPDKARHVIIMLKIENVEPAES